MAESGTAGLPPLDTRGMGVVGVCEGCAGFVDGVVVVAVVDGSVEVCF
jgi:hypothetical protein